MVLECFYHVKGSDKLTNEKHFHENCYELIQTISNEGNFLIKDTLYPIRRGTVFLINAIDIHCSVPRNSNEYIRNKIILNSQALDMCAELMGFEHIISSLFKENNSASINFHISESEKIDSIFADVYNLYNQGDPNNKMEILSLILHFLQICFNCHNEYKTVTSNCASDAMQYINDNISSDISLTQISKALFVTKNHLCKQFKKATGMTVSEYIKGRRISMAKKKLQFSDMAVAEIAQYCGFSNFSYFSKLFKSYEGMTPTKYREIYAK